jgi:hypothetical protein
MFSPLIQIIFGLNRTLIKTGVCLKLYICIYMDRKSCGEITWDFFAKNQQAWPTHLHSFQLLNYYFVFSLWILLHILANTDMKTNNFSFTTTPPLNLLMVGKSELCHFNFHIWNTYSLFTISRNSLFYVSIVFTSILINRLRANHK